MFKRQFENGHYLTYGEEDLLMPRALVLEASEKQALAEGEEHQEDERARTPASAAATSRAANSTGKYSFDGSSLFYGPLKPDQVQIIDASPASTDPTWANVVYADSDNKQRQTALKEFLKKRGPIRRRVSLPRNWREILVKLQVDMPNFEPALALLRAELALIENVEGSASIAPILLVGSPGIGKSMFAEALAAALGTKQYRVQMEAAETGSGLVGSAEYWGNSKTGMIFEVLVGGEIANPIFFLDELDKAPVPRHHTSPYDPLYALWEQQSAARFRDSSMPSVTVDASHIWWLATANSLDPIPAPILSRCHIVSIPEMHLEDAMRVVHRVYHQMCGELRLRMQPLAEGVAERLARNSPRGMKKALRQALGRARYFGRDRVLAEDVPQAHSAGASEETDHA